jgi:hypothetical protein
LVVAGTALPDWLSVVDRKLRLRPQHLDVALTAAAPEAREIAIGVSRHFADDDWFHRTRAFAEVSATLGLLFRERLRGSDGFRCGFLGHIVTEMQLDALLILRDPVRLERYYDALDQVDPQVIAAVVGQLLGRPAGRLAEFIPLFLRERIFDDYPEPTRLLRRLNQVQRRVRLPELPEPAAAWLAEARDVVEARLTDLLPMRAQSGSPTFGT